MTEPSSAALGTAVAVGAGVPVLTAFGISLGLHPGILIAGVFGAFVSIVLLNAVPPEATAWRTTLRRIAVLAASGITAGYMTPVVMHIIAMSDPFSFGVAFAIGASAEGTLLAVLARFKKEVVS